MKYPRVTITGVDQHTDLSRLEDCYVECGILYSHKRAGQEARYPSLEFIGRALLKLSHTALHVCGSVGRAQAIAGTIPLDMDRVCRIQVNGLLRNDEIESICASYPGHTIITQVGNCFDEMLPVPHVVAVNHAILMDSSGGLGKEPDVWRRPTVREFRRAVGFAGGIGPDNVVEVLKDLQKRDCLSSYEWWIDMEGKVRSHTDWLDLDKVEAVYHAAWEHLGRASYTRRIRP